MQRTTEKRVELFESYLASSSCIILRTTSIEFPRALGPPKSDPTVSCLHPCTLALERQRNKRKRREKKETKNKRGGEKKEQKEQKGTKRTKGTTRTKRNDRPGWLNPQTRLCLAFEQSHKHFLNVLNQSLHVSQSYATEVIPASSITCGELPSGETGYATSLYTSLASQSTLDLLADTHR